MKNSNAVEKFIEFWKESKPGFGEIPPESIVIQLDTGVVHHHVITPDGVLEEYWRTFPPLDIQNALIADSGVSRAI